MKDGTLGFLCSTLSYILKCMKVTLDYVLGTYTNKVFSTRVVYCFSIVCSSNLNSPCILEVIGLSIIFLYFILQEIKGEVKHCTSFNKRNLPAEVVEVVALVRASNGVTTLHEKTLPRP